MFRMYGPQWNNTRIILTDARYPTNDAALRYFMWEDWIKISFQRYFLTMKSWRFRYLRKLLYLLCSSYELFLLYRIYYIPHTKHRRTKNICKSGITSRYALRAVDLKDMVVIDLWNISEQRLIETLIRRRVIPGQPVAGPGTSQNLAADAKGWNHCFCTRALAHRTARPWMPPWMQWKACGYLAGSMVGILEMI